MNVSCPQCKTIFRVDPHKVPAEGVRARCSVCGGVFEVTAEPGAGAARRPAAPPPAAKPATPTPPEPAVGGESKEAPVEAGPPGAPEAPPPTPRPAEPPPPRPSDAEPPEPPPAPSGAPAPRPAAQPFGQTDPDARARRLARALISDVAAYNPERQEEGLREGRLKELFQEELKKSWQEYVEQVGLDLARRTPYFRDALNEILAKGQKVF